MYILLNIRLQLEKEGMICHNLSQICHAPLRKGNYIQTLPVGKLVEILVLRICGKYLEM